jgi:hypothetical protein
VQASSIDSDISAALAAYLDDHSLIGPVLDKNADLPVLARKFRALPVYADIGGALLIRPNGEVLLVHSDQIWDETAQSEVETDKQWLLVAYTSCAQRFPSLHQVARDLAVASNTSLERTRER